MSREKLQGLMLIADNNEDILVLYLILEVDQVYIQNCMAISWRKGILYSREAQI